MLQDVSMKDIVVVKAKGVWPSTGCLGNAWPHPER